MTTVVEDETTTTVATSSGATPIQSVGANPPSKRTAIPRRVPAKATATAATATTHSSLSDNNGKCVQKPERFPHAVYCHSQINMVTTSVKVVTAKRTITSTAALSTATVTSMNTHTTYDTETRDSRQGFYYCHRVDD
ncbi:hypothetical protein MGN70_008805 [Eutypa lata]|nr:hypothetical protein MGN70_008805 [Eutypa lata]